MITQTGWIKVPEIDTKKPVLTVRGTESMFKAPYNENGDYAIIITPKNVGGTYRFRYFRTEDGYFVKGNTQYVLGGKNFDLRIGQIKDKRINSLNKQNVQFIEETI